MRYLLTLIIAGLLSFHCDAGQDEISIDPEKPAKVQESAYTTMESGLKYVDLRPGSGKEAETGETVTVHYAGWLADNQKRFDSSILRDKPFTFQLGQGSVIPGWEEGVKGMKTGGIRQLVIPGELAYGEKGAAGVIPPDATLIFEVKLLEIR